MLAWVNTSVAETLKSMEGMHDGSVFCRLLDRLFHSTFPLEKVQFDALSFSLSWHIHAQLVYRLCVERGGKELRETTR